MWDGLLEKGFEEYRLLCIDLPGFGASAPQAKGSIADMAQLVINLIDQLSIERFVVFGHSMGGYVALKIAEDVADRILGLGLIHSHPFADSEETKINRQKAFDFISNHGSSLFIKQLIPNLFPKNFTGSHSFLIDRLIFNANNFPDRGIQNGLQAMKERPDLSDVLRKLQVPYMCVIGLLDTLLPTEKFIQQVDFASITELALLPNIGHMSPFENPKILRKRIIQYLATVQILSN